ncbi:hypothetical protein LC065_13390 [Halobacillus litoralis]|uniref:hypothetical protein n=1 Tax=Halobacillus litoralis TaxID=45668 RepID=UPI001CFEFF15|nr:hypothetical protein [Halobacillus litoralis]WLR46561.1 hypothetical protein LC065_13390 [Halobacillus litoralis]
MKYKYLIDRLNMEWINQVFSILTDQMAVEKIVELSVEDGVEFGKRRDVFNRLVDLDLLEKSRIGKYSYVTFTEQGQKLKNIYIKNSAKIPMLLHMLHVLKSFDKHSKRYFSTYYFTTKITIEDKKSSIDQYQTLIKLLEEKFPEEEHITGLDNTTIGKANVFLHEIMDNQYNYLTFVDPILFAYGLQKYIEAKTGNKLGNILITNKEKEELSILFLVSPDQIELLVEKSNRYTRAFETRYTTTGTILNCLKQTEF